MGGANVENPHLAQTGDLVNQYIVGDPVDLHKKYIVGVTQNRVLSFDDKEQRLD